MGLKTWLKPRVQDWTMSWMNNLRPTTLEQAEGDVLEIGFGTGLNVPFYGDRVRSVTGLDPMVTEGIKSVEKRIAEAPFPVTRTVLSADGGLPFDQGRFDCVVTTWTLCSIPEPGAALREMRRVLKPEGLYLFIEHGRSPKTSTAAWQDRLNPAWKWATEGCNINRAIFDLIQDNGFDLTQTHPFQGKGPRVASYLYQGIATKA